MSRYLLVVDMYIISVNGSYSVLFLFKGSVGNYNSLF